MGMGPLGVGSRFQKHHLTSLTQGEAFRKHMNFIHYRADTRLVRDYYFKSGDTINWLEDMGVEFLTTSKVYPAPERLRAHAASKETWYVVRPTDASTELAPRLAGAMIQTMTKTGGSSVWLQWVPMARSWKRAASPDDWKLARRRLISVRLGSAGAAGGGRHQHRAL